MSFHGREPVLRATFSLGLMPQEFCASHVKPMAAVPPWALLGMALLTV
jgi:hypothetical protein